MDSLKGKSVILTGAGSGIGKVTAKMLGEQGANVFVVGRRENLLKESVKEKPANYDGFYVIGENAASNAAKDDVAKKIY